MLLPPLASPPPTQRRPPLNDIPHRPRNPLPVHLLRDVIIRADHIELALLHLYRQALSDLVGCPGACRLVGLAGAGHAGERPAGDEEVHGDGSLLEVEGEVLGECLDGRLGRVVAWVGGGVGDSLLACVGWLVLS